MHSISELKNAKLIILQVEDLIFYIPLLDERERERERGSVVLVGFHFRLSVFVLPLFVAKTNDQVGTAARGCEIRTRR